MHRTGQQNTGTNQSFTRQNIIQCHKPFSMQLIKHAIIYRVRPRFQVEAEGGGWEGQATKDIPAVAAMLQAARGVLGYDLLQLCLDGPKDKLDQTQHAQVRCPCATVHLLCA